MGISKVWSSLGTLNTKGRLITRTPKGDLNLEKQLCGFSEPASERERERERQRERERERESGISQRDCFHILRA